MSELVEKARTFLEGIGAGDADLALAQIDPGGYVEHAPFVGDGAAGLRAYVSELSRGGRRVNVVRAFADGAYAVAQSEGELLGRGVFFDVFRFAGGAIVEHWGFATEAAPRNRSGHTQTDGPVDPDPIVDTEHAKAFVRRYYETVHLGGDHHDIERFFADGRCIRHEPGVVDGLRAFLGDVAVLSRNRTLDEIVMLFGRHDFVFIAARGTHDGAPCDYLDLYRVENDTIAERWGFNVTVPSPADRKNGNPTL